MSLVTLAFADDIATLTLDDGRGNALSPAMLDAIDEALSEAEAARVLVLRGREKVFSGGLDLPTVTRFDRAEMATFLRQFDAVHAHLFGFPHPIVTVARGSAIAGGAILLCAGDERLVTPDGRVGVTEAALGVNLPTTALELVRQALGERALSEVLQGAAIYEGEERRRVGFATEIVSTDRLDARARELAERWLPHEPAALTALRRQLRREGLERIRLHGDEDRERFLDLWFARPTHARLVALAERLSRR